MNKTEEIKALIKEPLLASSFYVDEVTYKNKTLSIIVDSDEVINVDRIVEATKIINKILDEKDLVKEQYVLDVSSKEKGGN